MSAWSDRIGVAKRTSGGNGIRLFWKRPVCVPVPVSICLSPEYLRCYPSFLGMWQWHRGYNETTPRREMNDAKVSFSTRLRLRVREKEKKSVIMSSNIKGISRALVHFLPSSLPSFRQSATCTVPLPHGVGRAVRDRPDRPTGGGTRQLS